MQSPMRRQPANRALYIDFKRCIAAIFMLFWMVAFAAPAQTIASPGTEKGPFVSYKLIPERTHVSPGEELTIAIEHTIAPHWHIYWKNPGDSGLPVKTEWEIPKNFEIENIIWPLPGKIYEGPLANYGYFETSTLLQTLKIPDTLPEGPINLTATIKVLVCNEICIPESATLQLTLNDSSQFPVNNAGIINAAKEKIPQKLDAQASFERDENNAPLFKLNVPLTQEFLENIDVSTAEFFPEEWGIVAYAESPTAILDGTILKIEHATTTERDLSELKSIKGLLTAKNKEGKAIGFEIQAINLNLSPQTTENNAQTSKVETTAPQKQNVMSTLSAIALAILGGIILNLMPCVFPVLSMKALSLVKMADKAKHVAKQHGLAYTAGIILSFLAIGIALITLKQAGSVIGWGFQLQNPIVVGSLAYLLFIIGLNLIGVFEFSSRFGNLGSTLTQKDSPLGSFFTGVLATIVATPCTAPFMGAALGFALVQPAPIAMLIFASIGLGLALPYLILSFMPALRKFMPKPGAWMEKFKQFLAFPMFASAIWLVWVISQQSGSEGILVTLLGMLCIGFAIWISKLHAKNTTNKIIRTVIIAITIAIPLTSLGYLKTKAEDVACTTKAYTFGDHFSKDRLDIELAGNKPIFVEMTAAWCITCKANHAIAINIESTKKLFEEKNVAYLIGDWTNYNEEITSYLDMHGRNGVPLYVFYGAPDLETGKRPEAVILPQVLTPTIVQHVIEGKK